MEYDDFEKQVNELLVQMFEAVEASDLDKAADLKKQRDDLVDKAPQEFLLKNAISTLNRLNELTEDQPIDGLKEVLEILKNNLNGKI